MHHYFFDTSIRQEQFFQMTMTPTDDSSFFDMSQSANSVDEASLRIAHLTGKLEALEAIFGGQIAHAR